MEFLRSMLMHSSRTFVWSATACGLVVLLSFFSAIGYDFYRSTIQMNEQAAMNIASLTSQRIARDIELYDLSLQSVLEGVTDPDILYQEPELRQKILFDRSATAPGLGSLVAIDEKGEFFLDSHGVSPRAGNFSDREYFNVHRNPGVGFYISKPFRARLQEGIWSISVSRRINKPDGGFGGIVSGTIRLSYFERIFDKVSMGSRDSIVLLRDDGTLVARNLNVMDPIGADWHAAPVFTHLRNQPEGTFASDQSMDGTARHFAFHRVGELPFAVVVGLSTDQILAPWRSKMLVLAGIFAIMTSSVLMLVWMLESELRRRATAEKAAELLARTDGLTKLANRRWFDRGLARKWSRAARDARPMSLLMIDVDHFKSFNDTYGHQGGDRVLRAIAGVISDSIRRPDDLAARYGGEEFAVVLPNTDSRGARQVAASIRDGVHALQIGHGGSEHSIVTVSIGLATAMPGSETAKPLLLVREADAALYRAKDNGRDSICAGDATPPNAEALISRAG
ncbi:sensor domain-containing diguanylate cyclase [Bradyrhizobium sp. SYSU BS000235]|uniref:sensor domain-containing diguanylate cyclase n=1 Tax=Bradyrhizobium sp. SYSU BS000235 TaxID=3411332 RepID=UPI003C78DB0A